MYQPFANLPEIMKQRPDKKYEQQIQEIREKNSEANKLSAELRAAIMRVRSLTGRRYVTYEELAPDMSPELQELLGHGKFWNSRKCQEAAEGRVKFLKQKSAQTNAWRLFLKTCPDWKKMPIYTKGPNGNVEEVARVKYIS